MNKKQLIVSSVLVLSMLVLAISQGFFCKNFERISITDKKVNEFKEYKLNVDEYFISLPNEWSVKENDSEGYISHELSFKGTDDNITGIIQVISTNEDVSVFAERDIKNQSLKYSDLKITSLEAEGRHGILGEYITSIINGNKYKNKCYYLVLTDNHILKVLFNIKNTESDNSEEDILKEIISSIKDTN